MRRELCSLGMLVALGGCGTPIDEGHDYKLDEYVIRGTSPGGMYGGFLGLAPSPDAVRAEAARICPTGYDTISETSGRFYEGEEFVLRVRCHADLKSQSSN